MGLARLGAAALLLALLPTAAASAGPDLAMEIAMTEKWAKPQSVAVFPATFSTRSTEPLRVSFEVIDPPQTYEYSTLDRALAPVPNPMKLNATTPITVPFTIQTPYKNGHLDQTDTITYRVTARPADQPNGPSSVETFQVTVHTKGFYVPAPSFALGALAVGVAALVGRRGS